MRMLPLLTTLLSVLFIPLTARGQVQDEAGLFSQGAIEEANRIIARMQERTGKGMILATVSSVPADLAEGVAFENDRVRREVFAKWVMERIESTDLDGIYVLICQEPRHIEIKVWPKSTENIFDTFDQEKLHKRLVSKIQPDNPDQGLARKLYHKLRSPQYNAGLLESVNYAAGRMEWNMPVDQTNWYWGLGVMGGMVGFWAVVGILRQKLRRQTPPEAGVYAEEESGRSIAVLGGAIGAVSGQWLVDNLFRVNRSSEEPKPAEEPEPRVVIEELPAEEPAAETTTEERLDEEL